MKKTNFILLPIILLSIAFGQLDRGLDVPPIQKMMGMMNMPNPQFQGDDRMSERMEMMMTWKLTNDLDLTTEQADKFFPRLKEHRENMEKIDKEIFSISEDVRKKIDSEKEISDNEINKALAKINSLEKQKIDKNDRFINELSDILSNTQRAKLALFKQYFIRDLQKQIRRRPQSGA